MTVKVKVEVTTDEINILHQASKIIGNTANDIDNEDIRYFAGYDSDDLRRIEEDIDTIIETLEKENE